MSSNVLNTDGWRANGVAEREVFYDWVDAQLRARAAVGAERYGNEFQGEPLAHLIEELLDALFYAYTIQHKMQWERAAAQSKASDWLGL